ncbi:MAG: dihydrofolate reductase family protein [Actinomycetota bacterium]
MNTIGKLVVSGSLDSTQVWQNSARLDGSLVDEVRRRKQAQDLIVTGSASVVGALLEHDLVDEFRLLVFPVVLGTGTRLFTDGTPPVNLQLVSAEPQGAAALLRYALAAS